MPAREDVFDEWWQREGRHLFHSKDAALDAFRAGFACGLVAQQVAEADIAGRLEEAMRESIKRYSTSPFEAKEILIAALGSYQKRSCPLCHAKGWCKHMGPTELWDHP